MLPLLGIALNGTSSVLYGTVRTRRRAGDTGRAFALFYTAVIGAGGSPRSPTVLSPTTRAKPRGS